MGVVNGEAPKKEKVERQAGKRRRMKNITYMTKGDAYGGELKYTIKIGERMKRSMDETEEQG